MQVESGTRESYLPYKIKRQLKILAVCAGIVVVSISVGMISALEFTSYAVSHQKAPAMAGPFSLALAIILMVGGVAAFMVAVWRVEYKARREKLAK